MKNRVSKQLIKHMADSDAYYVIGVKNNTNFSEINSTFLDDNLAIYTLMSGMLGKINELLKSKKSNNSILLIMLIKQAVIMFPELLKDENR